MPKSKTLSRAFAITVSSCSSPSPQRLAGHDCNWLWAQCYGPPRRWSRKPSAWFGWL